MKCEGTYICELKFLCKKKIKVSFVPTQYCLRTFSVLYSICSFIFKFYYTCISARNNVFI